MDEKGRRKQLRKEISRYGWALLLYYLFLNFVVIATAEIQLMYHGFQAVIQKDRWGAFGTGVMEAASALMENGWGYILACCVVVGAIALWKGKGFFRGIFYTKRAMTGNAFASLTVLFLSGQLVFQILAIVEELLVNLFGLSVMESMEMASAGVNTFSMFLYMGLVAPVVEEIIFRGALLRGFEPLGKRFAVFASAVLFGLFHGNLVQSPYAFAVGLVLGYTAMEYSIGWAMVLHMINNLILGDSLLRLMAYLPAGLQDAIYWLIYLVCGITGIVILIRNRQEIRTWLGDNSGANGTMRAFFTAVPNILLIILMCGNAVLMLFL